MKKMTDEISIPEVDFSGPVKKSLLFKDEERLDTIDDLSKKIFLFLRMREMAQFEMKKITREKIAAESRYKKLYAESILEACTGQVPGVTNDLSRKAHADLQSLEAWEEWQILLARVGNCASWLDLLKQSQIAVQGIGAGIRDEMNMDRYNYSGTKRG